MRPISAATRAKALNLLRDGASTRKVASECGISKSSVQILRAELPSNLPVNTGGRPAKLSPRNKRTCVHAITSGSLKTGIAVAKMLESDHGIKVCDRTVRNCLQEAGLAAVEKERKPKLSRANIKARLEFAKRHQHWTIDDWKRVIWSDETKINRFCSDGRSWCWVRDSESRKPHHVKQTVKHGGGSIMIWGCMAYYGTGFMCKIDGTLDKDLYKQILQGELLQTIDWYKMAPKEVIFQHDNDPKHTSKAVQEWLSAQPFEVLGWPSQSPDLNPIEHL
jgi:transposase